MDMYIYHDHENVSYMPLHPTDVPYTPLTSPTPHWHPLRQSEVPSAPRTRVPKGPWGGGLGGGGCETLNTVNELLKGLLFNHPVRYDYYFHLLQGTVGTVNYDSFSQYGQYFHLLHGQLFTMRRGRLSFTMRHGQFYYAARLIIIFYAAQSILLRGTINFHLLRSTLGYPLLRGTVTLYNQIYFYNRVFHDTDVVYSPVWSFTSRRSLSTNHPYSHPPTGGPRGAVDISTYFACYTLGPAMGEKVR